MRKNKGQQEIVGFMIIVVLVIIVGVVFLGVFLRQDNKVVTDDAEMENFLVSSLRYTSDCYRNEETKFKTLGELMSDCYKSRTCSNGKNACEVLNKNYADVLKIVKESNSFGGVESLKLRFYSTLNASD